MKTLKLSSVDRTYNGKSGCMCGCLGKYSTLADSARSVKIALNKVNNALANKDDLIASGVSVGIELNPNCDLKYAWVDDGSRNTVVYFN